MKDFDIARAVVDRLQPALPGRVELGTLIVEPERIREPLTVVHIAHSTPERKPGMAVRSDQVDIRLTTLVDAAAGQIYSRMENHMTRLRAELFKDHNLGGVAHVVQVVEASTSYQLNQEEMVFAIHLDLEVTHRRKASEP